MKPTLPLLAAALLTTVGFGLVQTRHRAAAQKGVTVPDVALGPDGKATLLPNGWQVTPAGRAVPLPGDLPLKMVLTPDGKYVVVNTAGYHDHTVALLDAATGNVVQSVNVGKDWAGLCLDPEGDDVYVSGGGTPDQAFLTGAAKDGATPEMLAAFQKPILRLSLEGGKLTPKPSLDIPGLGGDARWVAGLATDKDGALFAVNTNTDTVYKLGGQPRGVLASVKVGYRPYSVALSPDGATLAVSNWGGQSVSLLDPATLKETARVPVGSHPNELVWAKDGRLFVANAGSNSVSVVRGGKVTETIKTSLDPKAPVGSTPDAVALSPDGKRLYVANADNNDVAVVDTSDTGESRVLGFLPTGWYPSALAVSPDGRRLFVGTGKGLKFRANATAQTKLTSANTEGPYDYIGGVLSGAVSVVDLPDADQLKAYTQQVIANTPGATSPATTQAETGGAGAFSRIKHVVYIIRENRTYDQVFGDIKEGNGDPSLTLFGRSVTPNAHQLATNYVLLDNLYCNGEVSEDGHQWCDAAYATDFNERAWTNSYSGRGEPDADERLTASPAGYLWDNCARHGLTYRSYGEAASFKSSPSTPPVFKGAKTLSDHASVDYALVPTFTKGRDTGRAAVFLKDLHAAEQSGVWPRFMVMSLGEDHTQGTKAGAFTPTAHVANNDQALGKIVEAVSHSKFWPETAIFVIEDDAQNGPDHVDAHRTVGLVISPYTRHGVDSTLYTTASFVRTIELILGLPPMTQFDAAATPLTGCFTATPNLVAYNVVAPGVSLTARNTKESPDAVASAKLDLSDFDRADPDALNAILWHALKPGKALPAPVRSARLTR